MDKRIVLGLVLVAFLAVTAGCSAAGSLSMESVDDAGLAAEASESVASESETDRALVRDAIENGSAATVAERPPVDEPLPFRHDGRFYDISYAETGTEPGYRADIRIDYNASSVEGDVVDHDQLPAADKAVVSELVERADTPEKRLRPGYDFGAGQVYNETEANSSVLVTTQAYDAVRYGEEVYPIDVDSETETLTIYRYESELVAESATAYAEELRDEYEFELSGLSDTEREAVKGALNDTNYIEDDNEGFASLVERFRDHESVVQDDHYGYYVVVYEGQLYWAEMDYGSYAENEDASTPPEEMSPPEA